MSRSLASFILESNRIEGIEEVRDGEVQAHRNLLNLPYVDTQDLSDFVSVVQPGAKLRNQKGLNVKVGSHCPPPGGPEVEEELDRILRSADSGTPYEVHVRYEKLHPFTDGNGRSGRALWLWMMWRIVPEVPPLAFLHTWYYQSLDGSR